MVKLSEGDAKVVCSEVKQATFEISPDLILALGVVIERLVDAIAPLYAAPMHAI